MLYGYRLTEQLYGFIENDILDSAKLRGSIFKATLTLEDTILDQATVNIWVLVSLRDLWRLQAFS